MHSAARSLAFVTLIMLSMPAVATSQRTFVASNGLDTNACSLAAPCRTFDRAITQTNAGGEVIVQDSAGYGPVAVTKSITIAAPPGIYAGISVFTGDGVSINGASIIVVLRGLTINGQGPNGQGGDNGINVIDAAMVHVEGCVIANMAHSGIWHTVGMLEAKDTIVRNSAFGIYVQAGNAVLDHVRVEGNATGVAAEFGGHVAMQDSLVTASSNIGVVATDSTLAGDSTVTITRSLISFNLFGVFLAPGVNGLVEIQVTDSVISDNASWGVSNQASVFRASRTAILRNATAAPSGGIQLTAGAFAVLDSSNIEQNGSMDLETESTTDVFTRGNNHWSSCVCSGSIVALSNK